MTQKSTPFSWQKIGLILLVAGIALLTGRLEGLERLWPEIAEVVEPEGREVPAAEGEVVVARVIDGDTIELESGARVRYIGIDTPEFEDDECRATLAATRNRELTEGKTVFLEKDVSETDRYSRLLRYVWVEGKMVNEILVREGWAVVSTYPPDVKHQARFGEAEKEARQAERGFWKASACSFSP